MKTLILAATIIGNLVITSYRATPQQTDSSPFYTSTGNKVRAGGCAISRDLLCGACRKLHHRCKHPEYDKKIHYGEWLYVSEYGFRQVNDCMGAYSTVRKGKKKIHIPIVHHVDLFVEKWSEEHSIGVKQRDVFKVREIQ